jgi:hypothetical protein
LFSSKRNSDYRFYKGVRQRLKVIVELRQKNVDMWIEPLYCPDVGEITEAGCVRDIWDGNNRICNI